MIIAVVIVAVAFVATVNIALCRIAAEGDAQQQALHDNTTEKADDYSCSDLHAHTSSSPQRRRCYSSRQ